MIGRIGRRGCGRPLKDLTETERRLCDAFATGDVVTCENAEAVRAEVLTSLLLGPGGGQAIPSLRLTGATITGQLQLGFANIAHPLLLRDCVFQETPDLYWARMDFVQFVGCTMPGLRASNIHIARHLQLRNSTIDGEVRMSGARITGGLLLDGVRLTNPGRALTAERLQLGGDLVLQGAFIEGQVRLYQSTVGGDVSLDDVHITVPEGIALGADSMTVDGIFYARRARIEGEVGLRHARVSGATTFTGARLSNPDDCALRADRASLEGGLWLSKGFHSEGTIRLVNAQIGRGLVLQEGVLANAGATALLTAGARIDGGLDARGLTATGTIDLRESTISGPVQFEAAKLSAPDGIALHASRVTMTSFFGCNRGFVADGRVSLAGATIGGNVDFRDATVTELHCWRTTTPELNLHWQTAPESLDLRHTHVGLLRDDPTMRAKSVQLDGFTYDALEPLATTDRLSILESDLGGYLPQPYEQLAAVCRRVGHDDDARTVLLTKQRRRNANQPRFLKLWGLAQDVVVGYGYRPLRAATWLLLLLTIGTIVFTLHKPHAVTSTAPHFQPAVYTADILLPLIDLGQEGAFQPSSGYLWLLYTLMAAGWILVTTVAAGVARSVRRD